MADRSKRMISLDPSVDALLTQVGARGASAYVERAVTERWREWTSALSLLMAAGWRRGEILSACDALNGTWLHDSVARSPQAVALELADYASISGLRPELDVSPERWAERVRQVGESWELSLALTALATEWWTGNEACERAVERAS